MTKKEMTEIFGLLLLAYPNAEAFKGGVKKLAPTIELWCSCLPEVDFTIGQQAAYHICRENKYPPTISEFREMVERIENHMRSLIGAEWRILVSNMDDLGMTPQEAVEACGSLLTILAVKRMGGPDKLVKDPNSKSRFPSLRYDYMGFEAAFRMVLTEGNGRAEITLMPLQKAEGDKPNVRDL